MNQQIVITGGTVIDQQGERVADVRIADGQIAEIGAVVAAPDDADVIDGLLLLDENAAGGFPRDWHSLGLPPSRHYGYAVQWFALAAALTVIFIGMNTHKQTPGRGRSPK